MYNHDTDITLFNYMRGTFLEELFQLEKCYEYYIRDSFVELVLCSFSASNFK